MADEATIAPDPTIAIQKTAEVVDGFSFTRKLTDWFGAQSWISGESAHTLAVVTVLAALITCCLLLFVLFRPFVRWVAKRILGERGITWHARFREHRVYFWFSHLLPGLLVFFLSPLLFPASPSLANGLVTAAELYILATSYFVVVALIGAAASIISETTFGQHRNVTLVAQMARVVLTLVLFLLCLAVFLHKQPVVLLGSLGVFASVLMLIFKDVILGFGAGIQLSRNHMLEVGDWLEMPSHDADGTVEQIGISTVKVRNWDETITTVPTYALISESFRNWRGMSESGGRRIKRSLLIDTNSIRPCDEKMLDRLRGSELLAGYLEGKVSRNSGSDGRLGSDIGSTPVESVNVSAFRAYIEAYLRNHPDINQGMTLFARHLEPAGRGLPIEIYCFSAVQEWTAYEGIQADIFEHLLAIAPEFGLRIFQEPTGLDIGRATGH